MTSTEKQGHTETPISDASLSLLQDLTIVPQVVGYDHRISELDRAGLIEWVPGWGYQASKAGRAALAKATGGEHA